MESTINAKVRIKVPTDSTVRDSYVRGVTEPSLPLPTTAELRQLSEHIKAERKAAELNKENAEPVTKPEK